VKLVAGALNALADRVSTLLQEERESMADLSHELRTPVTALRLAADQIHDPHDAQRMNELIGRVEDAITQLIERARNPKHRAESGDLVTALAERLAFWAVLAKAQSRPVRVTIEDDQLPVRATPSDLDVTIDALIGNVFAHTPGGCGFDVRAERHNRSTRLVVDDSGPGIGHHVRRGISTAPSSGTGLGLDIARRVAERSGGKLTVGRSPTGGARIVVEFGAPASSLP
jgi:signal transduction histidine kinase